MSLIPTKRLQQAVFEALASQNRAQGSGGGAGMVPVASLGLFAGNNLGGFSTANSTTWTDITGTSFSVQVIRTGFFIYLLSGGAHISAGAGKGYIRGTFVGFDNTSSPVYGGATQTNGMTWYYPVSPGPIQPGVYTVKLQAATDNNTTTITVDAAFHQFFFLAAA